MSSLKTYMRTALAILLGERCVVCEEFLSGAGICPSCLLKLPFINIKGAPGNPVERLFWGVVPIVRASSMLVYHPGNQVERLIHSFKYYDRDDLAIELGRQMAQELLPTGFFDGIDFIQPVPLHPKRQRQRGYNQSQRLAQGIAEVTGIAVGDFVVRTKDNVSQTQLTHEERRKNVENIFAPKTSEVERLHPRHVLFVDDVITTGSTIISCIQSLTGQPAAAVTPRDEEGGNGSDEMREASAVPRMSVSVLSLGFAGNLHAGRLTTAELCRPSMEVDNAEFRERQRKPLF